MDIRKISEEIEFVFSGMEEEQIQWGQELVILYVIADKAILYLKDDKIFLQTDDFAVINPYTSYYIETLENCEKCYICMKIPEAMLHNIPGWHMQKISCFSNRQSDKTYAYNLIRKLFASILKIYILKSPWYNVLMRAKGYELLYVLLDDFSFLQDNHEKKGGIKAFEHIDSITRYITAHYQENIDLNAVSIGTNLSKSYLSLLFKKYFCMSFPNYVKNLRLRKACKEICNTDYSVTKIAGDCGFSKTSLFIQAFKEKYGETPRKYREKYLKNLQINKEKNEIYENDRISTVLKYAELDVQPAREKHAVKERRSLEIDCRKYKKTGSRTHACDRIITVGTAYEALTSVVKSGIKNVASELGIDYIRFFGIFNDEMDVYRVKDKKAEYHFRMIDLLLDTILQAGCMPYIELSYIPSEMASENTKKYLQNNWNVSIPRDFSEWKTLVIAFLDHCTLRYGIDQVKKWRFGVFGLHFALYGFYSETDYFLLFRNTYQAVKEVSPDFCIGGPSLEGTLLLNKADHTLDNFLERARIEGCMPDFITVHAFPHDFSEIDNNVAFYLYREGEFPMKVIEDEHFVKNILRSAKEKLKKYGSLGIVLEMFATSLWHRNPYNDTNYLAAFTVKHVLENMFDCDAIGYISLFDSNSESAPENTLFYGDNGLISIDGIKKSGYYAMSFLKNFSSHTIAQGNGWYAAGTESSYQLIFYNYCHVTSPYKGQKYFQGEKVIAYDVTLNGCSEGTYRIKSYYINEKDGNAYHIWQEMGEEKNLTMEESRYLVQKSIPGYISYNRESNGTLRFSVMLEPLEVKFFFLERIK